MVSSNPSETVTILRRFIITIILGTVLTGFADGGADIQVRFDNINGLVAKDRVVFDGAIIGTVKKISYGNNAIFTVSLSIEKDFRGFLTEYARFTISNDPRDNKRKAVEMLLVQMGGTTLENGSTVDGSSKYQVLLEMMADDAKNGIAYLKKEYQHFSKELKSLSEHDRVRELKAQMENLEKELKETSRETREKITSEIIPMLEKEIAELRKELEALGREEEIEPLEKELENIKYI